MPEEVAVGDFARRIAGLEADPAFRSLRRAQERTNLFRVVGKTDAERWHSAFWSWILDPAGSHGLRDFAVRQLLLRAVDPDGTVPAVRLEPSGPGHWQRVAEQGRLRAADLLSFDVAESVVAPGPQSGFREICPKVQAPASLKKDRDLGRFDIVLALDGDTSRGPMTLIMVVELKVNHGYRHQQLETYSSWLHDDPAAERLIAGTPAAAEFVQAYERVLARGARSGAAAEVWALGLFLSRAVPPSPNAPRDISSPWQALRYEDLVSSILEPMLADPLLDAAARPLVQSYIDVAFAEELSTMPTQEHKDLVRALVERNRDTIRIIARVLADSSEADLKDAGEALSEENDAARNRSLAPKLLIDNKLASLGDELEHSARKPHGAEKPLFDGKVVARLVSGDRDAFEFVSGAGLSSDQMAGRYTATGLLKKLYSHFNYPFPRNGNDCWTFATGPSRKKRLTDAYEEVRDMEAAASA